jgi:hypothetical protein
VTARHELLRSRNHPGDELNARAIEAPAGPVAYMREYRMNADLRLRLIVEDFDFAALDTRRVKEGDGLQRIIGLGIVNAKFEPQKIACVHERSGRE